MSWWLKLLGRRTRRPKSSIRRSRHTVLTVEGLEDRALPATLFTGIGGATFTNPGPFFATRRGTDTARFSWGVGVQGSLPSSLTFEGAPFSAVAAGQPFELGTLTYYNGTTQPGTDITQLSMRSRLFLQSPVGATTLPADFGLTVINTSDTYDPQSPDSVTLSVPDYARYPTYLMDGWRTTVEVLGFGAAVGSTGDYQSTNTLRVPEGLSVSVKVVARIKAAPTLRVFEGSPDQSPSQVQKFFINPNGPGGLAAMPNLTFEVQDLPQNASPDLLVSWTVTVKYQAGSATPPGAQSVAGFFFSTSTKGPRLTAAWPALRGGDLDVTAYFIVNSRTYALSTEDGADTRYLKILGLNPSRSEVQQLLDSYPVPANWPQDSGFDYHAVLRQIAYHETNNIASGGYNQFYPSGRFLGQPVWNTGGDGGAGLMQITPAAQDPRLIWDWRANVAAGVKKFNYGLAIALSYPKTLSGKSEFLRAVALFNRDRASRGLLPVTVVVPEWTPQQRVREAIRVYNGVGGTDSLGIPLLHEYQLAVRQQGRQTLLALDVNETTRRAVARWDLVPISQRHDKKGHPIGEPDYVNLVLASPTP